MSNTTEISKGRIPPQAVDMEEAFLGAMLIDTTAVTEGLNLLTEEAFYRPMHGLIFRAIRDVHISGIGVDMLTVVNHLKSKGELEAAGGEYTVIELSNKVSSSAHLPYHAKAIRNKFIQRKIIQLSAEAIDQAFDDTTSTNDLLNKVYSGINEISELSIKSQESYLGELIEPQIEKAVKIQKGEIQPGIPTPIARMTDKTGGWRNSELIILAARPGMGKTAQAISYGMHAARLGFPTAFFSLEMSKEQLTNRVIAAEARVASDKLTKTGLTEEEALKVHEAIKPILETQFIISDNADLGIEDFQIQAKRLKSRYGIKLIIIDYLQLMSGTKGKGANREQEISRISRGLKLVAKELDIPVIALSQLSRSVESQGGHKRPLLSHLRESGAIEQDADIVGFLYRPEYYNIKYWGDDYNNDSTDGQAEYIIAKNRNGGLVKGRMGFEGQYTRFYDLDQQPINPIPMTNIGDFQPLDDEDQPF